jgi:hypothetical protein
MKNKIWNMTTISTESQNILIYPEEMYDGIIVEIKELEDKRLNGRLYLNKDEMELFTKKMQEMMDYVKA